MANPYYAYGAYGYGQVQTYQTPPVAPAPVAPAPTQPYSQSMQYYQQPQTPQQSNYYYAIVTSQQQTPGSSSPAVVTSGTYAAYQSQQTPGRGRGIPAVGRAASIGAANNGGQGQGPQGGRGRGFGRGRGGFTRGRGGGFGRGGPGYDGGQAANNVSPIDAAVLSVAQSYMTSGPPAAGNPGANANAGKRWPKPAKPAGPNPNAEMKYCETCKVSCVGAQAFSDHLNGKLHKKKEEQAKRGGAAAPVFSRGQKQLHCELCDVSCIGSDSYDAHVRGVKHQKVLKLYQTMGKPIPASEPTLMQVTVPDANTGGAVVKKLAVPKMTFVGGTQLKSTESGLAEERTGGSAETDQVPAAAAANYTPEPEIQPIGEEYVEAVVSSTGHVARFHCKLCVCDFNDENARLLHLKGRRHRQTYKQKVDPSLMVEPDSKIRRMEVKRAGAAALSKALSMQRSPGIVPPPRGPVMPLLPPGTSGMSLAQRRPETMNDRYIMAKHATIYPNDDELQIVQSLVMTCEKALKLVSDHLVESDTTATGETTTTDSVPPLMSSTAAGRALKGVMRVGVLAKGLIMRDELNVHLLILCAGKPTRSLLNSIYAILPDKLAEVSAETFETALYPEEAAFVVAMTKDPRTTCTVTLTSPIMRQENLVEGADAQSNADPADMLDRQKCLDALAALRHAKWFQAKATPLPSCVIVIRILLDMCRRVPAWHALSQWAVELLVERCLATGEPELSPSLALRRVFEAISAGLLLPGGPGVLDPCEKEPVDALAILSDQEREDITASAQQALRMLTMQQMYKVLDVEPMGGKMPVTPVSASTPDVATMTDAAVKRPPPSNSTMGGDVKKIKTETEDEQA